MEERPSRIPAQYVERFYAAYAAFVAEVRKAIQDAVRLPGSNANEELSMWEWQAFPALEKRLAQIENAVSDYRNGDEVPIVQRADDASGISKNLDPFPRDFAGPDHASALNSLLTQVVFAAYMVRQAAGLT